MTSEEVVIRDLSRSGATEWIPPISAMGGPPGHELYRDLVLHAGMRLYRGPNSEPWVILKDGERRRAYRVPSAELVNAFDRFRMRRNLRPVPEKDIDDFTRTIQARASDPDARIPSFDPADSSFTIATPALEPDPILESPAPVPNAGLPLDDALELPDEPGLSLNPSTAISGGRMAGSEGEDDASTLPLYVRVLRDLVRHGDWLGSLTDLSSQIGEDSFTVFASLLRYRAALAQSGVVIAPVETEVGWQWLAVDRSRVNVPP